jgi:murein DD-endopeptidase MepM/ murein hydrolase activator NlpD
MEMFDEMYFSETLRTYYQDMMRHLERAMLIAGEIDQYLHNAPPYGGNWRWHPPVGSDKFPTRQWYAATLHDTTGALNNGYKHTGIDLNADKMPWGDIDRGEPVYAMTNGVIHHRSYSEQYLGSVVYQVEYHARPLYIRYWHLEYDAAFLTLMKGYEVRRGDVMGHIGNYTLGAGGDHLHLDMALDSFEPHWWFPYHPEVRWIDPVPVMKQYMDPDFVDAMLRRGDA